MLYLHGYLKSVISAFQNTPGKKIFIIQTMKMKKYFLLLITCIFSFSAYTQNLPELLSKSTDQQPAVLKDSFPHFFDILQKEMNSDKYITKVYYSDFTVKDAVRYDKVNGTIFINKVYFTNQKSILDPLVIWQFYMALGAIHFKKDNPEKDVQYEELKSCYFFSIEKTKECLKNGYCKPLFIGLGIIIGDSKNATDLNIKQAAIDVMADNLFSENANDLNVNGCFINADEKPASKVLANAEAISASFENLKVVYDDMTNKTFYYDKRTNYSHLYGDGLFAGLYKDQANYYLTFAVYHIPPPNFIFPYKILKVIINNGSPEPVEILGNPSLNIISQVSPDRTKLNIHYRLLKPICVNNICKIRFYFENGGTYNYSLSNREIKEIASVLETFELLNGIQK